MEKKTQNRLTEGPILKTLIRLALPIVGSSFLGTVYSITDMAWIGMLGSRAVAGVGVGGMYVWLSQGIVSLARMGGQVHVAQCFGRNEKEKAANYAMAAVQMTILFALVFSAFCLLLTDPLIGFFNLNDAESIDSARIYTRITCGLILFSYLSQTLTGLYTAQGDSRTPFLANLLGLVTNMILDPVLILGIGPFPRLEVAGAAIATVTAQVIVSGVMLISAIHFSRQGNNVLFQTSIHSLKEKRYYGDICKMGIPTALQGMIYCMISMVLAAFTAVFGPAAIAVQRLGGQIESVSWNVSDGFAASLNAFVGQNYGAGKMERVRKGCRYGCITVAVWGLMVTLAFLLLPELISRVFFHEEEALAISVNYLKIIAWSEAFMCVELTAIGALSGLGKTKL
ncbi:MAG: MATE family efflux transporter, partial [Lachnospiraceae bacterium]|nr:MATE family efflux transporter [Lachnospiraceae bacterium]